MTCADCAPHRGAAFVMALNSFARRKTRLLYLTFLDGAGTDPPIGGQGTPVNEEDAAYGIAMDAAGLVHLAGLTYAKAFPVTAHAAEPQRPACKAQGSDGFVVRLNLRVPTGLQSLQYSTFLGGSGPRVSGDTASAVAVDGSGDIYVAGTTASADFPTTPTAAQFACAGCTTYDSSGLLLVSYNAFVAKLDPAATGHLPAKTSCSGENVPRCIGVPDRRPMRLMPLFIKGALGIVPDGDFVADVHCFRSCVFERQCWILANRDSDHPTPNASIPDERPRPRRRYAKREAANFAISDEKLPDFRGVAALMVRWVSLPAMYAPCLQAAWTWPVHRSCERPLFRRSSCGYSCQNAEESANWQAT